jgi:hypothetical protein
MRPYGEECQIPIVIKWIDLLRLTSFSCKVTYTIKDGYNIKSLPGAHGGGFYDLYCSIISFIQNSYLFPHNSCKKVIRDEKEESFGQMASTAVVLLEAVN